jgi:RNA polymerase sigma-70 factor (ECF subfamily)
MMSIGSLSLNRTASPERTSRVRAAFASAENEPMATQSEQRVNMVRPPKEVADHELLQRFVAGSEEAYVELYLRRQAEVYTFCMRLAGGDRDFASDLFQETFIKVYRKAHTFREGTNVLGWLYTIVRTTYLNHKRKRTNIGLDDSHAQIQSSDRSLHPEFRYEQATIKERVEQAIANLPVEIREPFILREFDGFSYQEIAEQLNLTLGGVRQRIYRAKLAMREELRDLVHDDADASDATSQFLSVEESD